MSRILLVDDSPHAQRIGERILTDEGFEVITVSNGESALIRLEDADPDVLIIKAMMPGRSGFEVCRFVKMSPKHRHVRVVLTSGASEKLDETEVERAGADGALQKPFEASILTEVIRPLAQQSADAKAQPPLIGGPPPASSRVTPEPRLTAPMIAVIDPEQVRAAVTVALDASMDRLVEELTTRVLAALTSRRGHERTESKAAPPPVPAPPVVAPPALPSGAAPPPLRPPEPEPVRHVTRAGSHFVTTTARTPARPRTGSILGLSLSDPETPEPGEDS